MFIISYNIGGIKIFGRSLLSNIIQENVSKNKLLDTEEVKRATDSLKRISNEENIEVREYILST
jgi:hypothetical protein